MGKIIAVANQKGGVGKTTTCVNLTCALKKRGRRVLLVDCDPQGNSTSGMGVDKTATPNCYDKMCIRDRAGVDARLPDGHDHRLRQVLTRAPQQAPAPARACFFAQIPAHLRDACCISPKMGNFVSLRACICYSSDNLSATT